MGCGPYFLTDWEQGNKHVFTKNPTTGWLTCSNYDTVKLITKRQNAVVACFEVASWMN